MKLIDALKLLRQPPAEPAAVPLRIWLVCGFQPLHLETFLAAHLRRRSVSAVETRTGLFEDVVGSLERFAAGDLDAGAVTFEWSDFDPRLGWRRLGGWSPDALPDILRSAQQQMERLAEALTRAAERIPFAVSLPTLSLPPIAYQGGWETGNWELNLRRSLADFASRLGDNPRIRLISENHLARLSPPAERHDLKAELAAGFPYSVPHASALGDVLAQTIVPASPKKGIITDLDDTLWRGLVGEVGADAVHWDLDAGSHVHALYQQLLCSLAEAGTLIAIASKNDPALAGPALQRGEMLLPADKVFPVEINWGPKSESVSRILKSWNIGAQDAIFVDDSPLELAEVEARHPSITCVQFPASESEAADFLTRLRNMCGKRALEGEDALRLQSLRANANFAERQARSSSDDFLADIDSEIVFDFVRDSGTGRALELINKTNQWNLNGRRWSEVAWQKRLQDEETFVLMAAYRDKFGPLGAIAVLSGKMESDSILLDAWVMSCRAFARRIEHSCLQFLFEKFPARAIRFDFEATERNGPLRAFLEGFDATAEPLSREGFNAGSPRLHHRIKEAS